MMQVEYRLKLGQDEFVLKADVKDEKEFFETMSFYSGLPKTAPGGATDLKLVFRTTTDGHKYYSLVSEKEKMEFKFGQNKENKGGGLFPKGWEKLYEGSQDSQQYEQQETQSPTPPQTPAPAKVSAPKVNIPKTQTQPPQTSPVPTQTAVPNVNQQANNVLARFGIKK